MINPIILAKGNFIAEDIVVSVNESNRKIDDSVESKLEELWKEKLKKAKENGQHIYNGLSYRLNLLRVEESKLILDFGIFDFKTRECLIEVPGYYNLSQEYYRKGCHSLATVKTLDNKYLMVELSGKSMNVNRIDFLGGIMETDPPIVTGKDIFESLYKELQEEAFISRNNIKETYLKLVYINSKTNVGFYFEVILNILSTNIEQEFNKNTKEVDIKSLKIMTRSEYITELKNHNQNKQFIAKQVEI